MLKTEGKSWGFQHLPRDLANVNEWKIMFDPYIDTFQELQQTTDLAKVICLDVVNKSWP